MGSDIFAKFEGLDNSMIFKKLTYRVRETGRLVIVRECAYSLAVMLCIGYLLSGCKATKQIEISGPQPSNQVPATAVDNDPVPMSIIMTDTVPVFPGGEEALYAWLAENISYPEDAANQHKAGTVIVEFIVETDGSVSSPKVVRTLYPSHDNEAIRVIKDMPKWEPMDTPITYSLPINFCIQ